MKFVYYFLLTLVFFLQCTNLNAHPWTDTSRFNVGMNFPERGPDGSDYWFCMWPNIQKEYERRFGGFPNYMLWKDAPKPISIPWGISYDLSREEYKRKTPWKTPVTIKDVKDYLYWKLENSQTKEITYIVPKFKDENESIDYSSYYGIGWGVGMSIDAWSLPIDENIAYRLSAEVWDGAPPNGTFIADSKNTVNVVLANHETILDHYLEKYWKDQLKDDPDFLLEYLATHPFHEAALQELHAYYVENEICDSLKRVTAQIIYVRENLLDPFYGQLKLDDRVLSGPHPMDPKFRRSLMNFLVEVCGDTLLPPPWRTK